MVETRSTRRTHGRVRRHFASLAAALAASTLGVPILALASCGGAQSALNPAGRAAHSIAELFWWMAGGALLIWALMVALAIYAIGARRELQTERRAKLLIVVGGVAFPTATLTVLLIYGLALLPDLVAPPPAGSLRISVEGRQWWWRVRYESESAGAGDAAVGRVDTASGRIDLANDAVELANEIRLPVGEPVEFRLTSADVIHSFWIPALGGKVDMLPGRETRLVLHPTRTGVFTGVCAEYCGSAHARMAFDVIVVEPHEFEEWLALQREPARELDGESAAHARGAELFRSSGCGACHAVRGTSSDGVIGPDLTHVASRASFGARTLRNESGAALRWLTHTSVLKPGVLMPAFDMLPPEDLRALAAYVESLR